jgi:mono/diheme cytochrome c family protein
MSGRGVLIACIGSSLTVLLAVMGMAGSSKSQLVSHLENGRQIYFSGVTADGRVVENSHGMRGMGCVMCHGESGGGGIMHGVPVPDITFSHLTDPRGYEHENGRKRPAYNEESVKAAIVAGIDSGGNTLHPEMPRWTGLTQRDLEALIGYLKTLGKVPPRMPSESFGL